MTKEPHTAPVYISLAKKVRIMCLKLLESRPAKSLLENLASGTDTQNQLDMGLNWSTVTPLTECSYTSCGWRGPEASTGGGGQCTTGEGTLLSPDARTKRSFVRVRGEDEHAHCQQDGALPWARTGPKAICAHDTA